MSRGPIPCDEISNLKSPINMNVLDILIAIPLIFYFYKGWKRGFIFEVAALAGVIVGCWVAVHFSTWVADWLGIRGEGTALIAFIITFIGVVIGAFFLGKAIEGFIKMVKAHGLNKLLGAVMGLIKSFCVVAVLLNFIVLVDSKQDLITPTVKARSSLYKPAMKVGGKLTATLKVYVDKKRAR